MSGLDLIVYIAGFLLLTKLLLKELIGVVSLTRSFLVSVQKLSASSPQLEGSKESQSGRLIEARLRADPRNPSDERLDD